MDYPMHAELEIGNKFPNFELPDQTGTLHKLPDILPGFPGTLVFGRGYYCAKDRCQLTNYVTHLQPEMKVNYCKLISVSVDNKTSTNETRDALAAQWPFLMDHDRKLLCELQMVDTTDSDHGEVYDPYSFSLDGDRTIHKIYNGWYYVGRPTGIEKLTSGRGPTLPNTLLIARLVDRSAHSDHCLGLEVALNNHFLAPR